MGSKTSKFRGTGRGSASAGAGAGAGGALVAGQVVRKSLNRKQLGALVTKGSKTGTLSLVACKLTRLPPAAVSIAVLRKLDLSYNDFTAVPDLTPLAKLRTLVLSHNKLAVVSPTVASLPALTTLTLDHNALSDLPPLPPAVTALNLSHNRFAAVPDAVAAATTLKDVNLAGNALVEMDARLAGLGRLEVLNLDGNRIRSLANVTHWAGLASLQVLILSNNQLIATEVVLPPAMFSDTRVHRMQLEGNRITQRELQVLPGFDAFLARRKQRIDKGLQADVGGASKLCGL